MRIKSSQISWRDVFTSDALANGRRWTSPKTGKSVAIVGVSGDADDPSRAGAPFIQDSSLAWDEYPDLYTAFPKYELARRLDPEGKYDRSQERICIPATSAFDADLLGYGPDEWHHDGVTGAEIDAKDRASHGWKPLLWPHPERMTFIPTLQVGQLIRSEQFVRARPLRRASGTIMYLYHQPADPLRDDPSRADAVYRVESIEIHEDWTDLGDYFRCQVRCSRVNGGLLLAPQEQILEFEQQMDTKDDVPGRSFKAVEVIEGS